MRFEAYQFLPNIKVLCKTSRITFEGVWLLKTLGLDYLQQKQLEWGDLNSLNFHLLPDSHFRLPTIFWHVTHFHLIRIRRKSRLHISLFWTQFWYALLKWDPWIRSIKKDPRKLIRGHLIAIWQSITILRLERGYTINYGKTKLIMFQVLQYHVYTMIWVIQLSCQGFFAIMMTHNQSTRLSPGNPNGVPNMSLISVSNF